MNKEKLKQLAEDGIKTAKRLVEETGYEELLPVWMVMGQDGKLHVVGTPFGSDEEKDLVAATMRKFMREKKAVAYVFISECWMKSYRKDTPRDQMIQPSKCEDRKEMVYAVGESIDGDQIGICAEILRDADNKRTLAPFEYPEAAFCEERFVGLLD